MLKNIKLLNIIFAIFYFSFLIFANSCSSKTDDYFNEILISRHMEYETKIAYMNNTAGLNDICFGVDKFLKAFFTTLELHSIEKTILKLKSVFSSSV